MTTIINASSVNGITISSDTSGQLAFQSNGGNTITVPQVAGTMLTTGSPQSGGVIQVVNYQATVGSTSGTTSSSYVNTGLSLAITPKFSTSKILARCWTTQAGESNNGANMVLTIYRNGSTDLSSGATYGLWSAYCTNSTTTMGAFLEALDSPATTSSTTYALYARIADQSGTFNYNRGGCSWGITLMEIAA